MSSESPALETEDLGYSYSPGRYAIRHLNVRANRGEVLGLLGRNGAGKTTTVRLLTTLIPPTEGTARVLGLDVRSGGRALRGRIGVVLQAESLDFVTVERNLTLYAFLWGVPREVARSRAEEMLELFELEHVRRRKPWALSGGERRRFQVARELMHDMELLFLDEPTVGLDAVARRRILAYLRKRARQGLTIVFTTHILHEADMLCDRIAVLHEGKLVAEDTPEGIKRVFGGAREVVVGFSSPISTSLLSELTNSLSAGGAQGIAVEELPGTQKPRIVFRSVEAEEQLSWLTGFAHRHSLTIDHLGIRESTLEGAFLGLVGALDEDEEQPDGAVSPIPGAPP